MPKIKVNDINIYYELHGNRENFPLIVINGLAENIFWWSPEFINEVSRHFLVVLFDNRGAGLTDKPDIEYTIEMMANDIVGLLDTLNFEKVHIMGHSMGARIAQEFTITYPERVEKLVLCSGSAGGDKHVSASEQVIELLSKRGKPEYIIEKVTIPVNFSKDFIKNNPVKMGIIRKKLLKAPIPGRAYKHQYSASMKHKLENRSRHIKAPTLILHGKKDILVPPQNAEALSTQITGAKLVFFENSAHILFWADPKKEIKVLVDFLL
ncbi:MAG: alpha/beta fold hydrolase [Promethearchaeota archaeon]